MILLAVLGFILGWFTSGILAVILDGLMNRWWNMHTTASDAELIMVLGPIGLFAVGLMFSIILLKKSLSPPARWVHKIARGSKCEK